MKRLNDVAIQVPLKRPDLHTPVDYIRRAQPVHSRQLFQDVVPPDTTEVLQRIRQLKSRGTSKVSTSTPRQTITMVPHRPQPSRVLMRPKLLPIAAVASQQIEEPVQQQTLVVRLRRKLWRIPARGQLRPTSR